MSALPEGSYEAVVQRTVLEGADVPLEVIEARPVGTALATVVIAPDVYGLRPLFEDVARRLATHGVASCAPEPFARVEAERRAAATVEERLGWVAGMRDEHVLSDLSRAADHLEAAHQAGPVAVLGFCMGGYYAFKAAATGRFGRAVSFYGMVGTPAMWAGPGHRSPLDTAADACPTLALFGALDHWTPPEDIEALRHAFAGHPGHKVIVYPEAEHGFAHDPGRPAHRPDDARDAWHHALVHLLPS